MATTLFHTTSWSHLVWSHSLMPVLNLTITAPAAWIFGLKLPSHWSFKTNKGDDIMTSLQFMIYIKGTLGLGDDLDDRAAWEKHHGVTFRHSLEAVLCLRSLCFPGISTLIAKGVYDAAFPLHDVSVKFEIPTRRPLFSINFTTKINLQRMEMFFCFFFVKPTILYVCNTYNIVVLCCP